MKNKAIYIRLSEADLQMIDRRAKALKMSRSKFLISAAEKHQVFILAADELKELVAQLRKVGVNVNQIATLCNMGKITCVHIEDTNEEITKIWKSIDKLRKTVKKLNE